MRVCLSGHLSQSWVEEQLLPKGEVPEADTDPELSVLPRAPLVVPGQERCPARQEGAEFPAWAGPGGDDGGGAAGPQLLVQSPDCCPEVPADTKRLKRDHKESLAGGLELPSPASSCSQQHLDPTLSRDLLLPPSSHLSGETGGKWGPGGVGCCGV